jgi:hypothetical protein
MNVTLPTVPTNRAVPGCINQISRAPPSLTVQAWLFWSSAVSTYLSLAVMVKPSAR